MNDRTPISRFITAPLLIAALTAPCLMGCQTRPDPPPPVDDTRTGAGLPQPAQASPTPTSTGISTGTKVAVLAGAAALYYMYKRHQTASAATGEDSQYYLSKNGRVYYRDADHRAHWVTPPPGGIQVPESEAADYRNFQGYNNNSGGRDLTGLSSDAEGP